MWSGKYFEGGLGITFLNDNFFGETIDPQSRAFGMLTFGYRRQPEDGGFTYRVALTPIFGAIDGETFFIPYFGGISGGYAF